MKRANDCTRPTGPGRGWRRGRPLRGGSRDRPAEHVDRCGAHHRRCLGARPFRIEHVEPLEAPRRIAVAARALRVAVGQAHLPGEIGAQEVRQVGAVRTDGDVGLVFLQAQMIEQHVASTGRAAPRAAPCTTPWRRRRVEELLDPGRIQVLGVAIPIVAHPPYAARVIGEPRWLGAATVMSWLMVVHSAGAPSRTSLACQVPAAGVATSANQK